MTENPATTMHVGGASPYDVLVGHSLLGELPRILGPKVEKVALIFAAGLGEAARGALEVLLQDYGVLALGVPDGEAAKTTETVDLCWQALGEEGFTRSDAIVTFGGGATTDVGGFIGATWLRGVRVVHVPTTVLGMVDAAVGGKTGINTGAGKNLVGAFHEPAGVICDLDLLATLPPEDLVAGMGEVVKCGFIADTEILTLIERHPEDARQVTSPVLRELIERAIKVKIDVVVDDLTESGGDDNHPGREVLNYGHTLGHALEKTANYTLRHGEAVAVGCIFAAELACITGSLSPDVVQRHRDLFAGVGLPTSIAELGIEPGYDDIRAAMAVDKKSRGNTLRFLTLAGIAQPRILADPPEEAVRAAFAAVGGEK